MFKNATLFKIADETGLATLADMADLQQFTPCLPTQAMSYGWAPPREENGALIEAINGHWMMKCVIETKSVPSGSITKRADEMAAKIEHETGCKPGRKQMKELKEQATLELLPAAFPKQTAVLVWIDTKSNRVVLDTASIGRAEMVVLLLVRCAAGMQIAPLQTKDSPVSTANGWLADGETGVALFGLGRDADLHATDESKAVIKYKAHSLDTDDVKAHINSGKTTKRLGLCWNRRIDFVLDTEMMVLRRLAFDDVVFEGWNDADAFDADVAILTGELGELLSDLVEALGGEPVKE